MGAGRRTSDANFGSVRVHFTGTALNNSAATYSASGAPICDAGLISLLPDATCRIFGKFLEDEDDTACTGASDCDFCLDNFGTPFFALANWGTFKYVSLFCATTATKGTDFIFWGLKY